MWIVPTPASKDRLLNRFSAEPHNCTIFTWDDIWSEAARAWTEIPPARLSDIDRRLLIDRAVRLQREAGGLRAINRVIDRPGYRRLLAQRFKSGFHAAADDAGREEAAIHRTYLELCLSIGRVDPDVFEHWAITSWEDPSCYWRFNSEHVIILVTDALEPRRKRFCDILNECASSMTLVGIGDIAELTLEWAREREFQTEFLRAAKAEPTLEQAVDDTDEANPVPTRGLKILGGPGSEGQARLIASELRRAPVKGRVVLLVTDWNPSTREIVDRLSEFGIDIQPPPPLPLLTSPLVVRLLQTCRLPGENWPLATVAKILGTGGLSTDWIEAESGVDLTRVVADLRRVGVHRGIDAALEQLSTAKTKSESTSRVLDAFRDLVLDASGGRSRSDHQAGLARLASALGFDGDPAWETISLLFESEAEIREAIDAPDEEIPWDDFVDELESTCVEESLPDRRVGRFAVQTCKVDEFKGSRAARLILVDLTEGTFPAESALQGTAQEKQAAYAREQTRFKRVVGSADTSLILTYPTVNDGGEELLPAGFLDTIIRRLPKDEKSVHVRFKRFDPTFSGNDDLALTPNDQRVLAMAKAVDPTGADFSLLAELASEPDHRPALEGTAFALALASHRFEDRQFGPFDGLLSDPKVAEAIRSDFGHEAIFSASQVESYLWCPFQFFLKYVLRLKPPFESGELDLDFARFGSRLHDQLETAHQAAAASSDPAALAESLRIAITSRMGVELTTPGDEVAKAILEIEKAQAERVLRQYVEQFTEYVSKHAKNLTPSRFELGFGPTRKKSGTDEVLTIGAGPHQIRLQGMIDRVDVLETDEGLRYRIIDYKTFAVPSGSDVGKGIYVQLPLYALAVQRLKLLGDAEHSLEDFGYWGLSKDGYVKIRAPKQDGSLEALTARIEQTVLDAAQRLRRADFSVTPVKDDCSRSCDFATVCRIQEVRNAGKSPPDLRVPEAQQADIQARD